MSDLVGNPNCWFSHAQAHIVDLIEVDVWTDYISRLEFLSTDQART